MASNRRICPLNFKFFRILLHGVPRKLSIPVELSDYLNEEESVWTTFLSPLGSTWPVKIERDGRVFYFAQGWDLFAAAHKLSARDFLLFNHIGDLVFKISVFDRTTWEKDFSNLAAEVDGGPVLGVDGEHCFREPGRPPLFKTTAATTMEQTSIRSEPDATEHQQVQMQDRIKTNCFEVRIRPNHKYTLPIPPKFKETNELSGVHRLVLRDPKGHLWHVKLVHSRPVPRGPSYLSAGWQAFRVGNSLDAGDVCTFELVAEEEEEKEMRVVIHRRRDIDSAEKKISGDETSRRFKTELFPSHLGRRRGYLNIPKAFLSSVDLSGTSEFVLVDPRSRRWPVHLGGAGWSRRLGVGWTAFREANDLKIGDVCAFTLESMTRAAATFHVEVSRSGEGASAG